MSRIIEFDLEYPTEGLRLIRDGSYLLRGKCKRCGKCCMKYNCEHLGVETVDDKPKYFCRIYRKRPVSCALWPLFDDKKADGCGFYWVKE